MEEKKVIVQIRKVKTTQQKQITVPKSAEHLQEGDYVEIKKVEFKDA